MTGLPLFDIDTDAARDADLLTRLLDRADSILVKKLSNNDRDWARFANKHQGGIYIPAEQRECGFFPPLTEKDRGNPDAAAIREAFFLTTWPQIGGIPERRRTRIVHYTSKGPETHLTGLPKTPFANLSPASFLVMGRSKTDGIAVYECLTIDSAGEEADLLAGVFGISPGFSVGIFDPQALRTAERDRLLEFIDQVVAAWLAGKIARFAKDHATMPGTGKLADMARQQFLAQQGLKDLNPFCLPCPGDVLRDISRNIEWEMFRDFQRRERSVELVRILLGDTPARVSERDVIRLLIEKLPEIDALMLSASQQRKSRAGYSYEHHIEAMLAAGAIPFEKQVIIEARKRPDFILPSLAFLDGGTDKASTGLILSAKTTLRERWKQVEREKGNRALYLTTVDENIAGNAIEDMASIGVTLVVPEGLMEAKETEYAGHANVMTFAEFCHEVVAPAMTLWHR